MGSRASSIWIASIRTTRSCSLAPKAAITICRQSSYPDCGDISRTRAGDDCSPLVFFLEQGLHASGSGELVVNRICWCSFVWGLLLIAGFAQGAETPTIQLNGGPTSIIEAPGLSAKDIEAIRKLGLKGKAWKDLLAVYVEAAEGK